MKNSSSSNKINDEFHNKKDSKDRLKYSLHTSSNVKQNKFIWTLMCNFNVYPLRSRKIKYLCT